MVLISVRWQYTLRKILSSVKMQYYFGQFRLSIDTVELFYQEQVISIDPKMFEVLCFFCVNTDRVISREELLTKIWKNSIVSENTLNKLIASLRKSLNDNAKSPTFIQTVPKLGYRFICPVTQSESHQKNNSQRNAKTNLPNSSLKKLSAKFHLLTFSLVIAVIVLSLLSWKYLFSNTAIDKENATDIQTLTRMAGNKFSPFIAQNGKTLTFLTRQAGIDKLWIKALNSNELSEILHSFEHIDQIVQWENSNEIVLLVRNKGKKQIMRGQVVANKLHLLSQSMVNINNWRIYDIAAIKNNQFFMIAKSSGHNNPALYSFNFFKPGIEQVPLNINDNAILSRLDINPQQTRILLLSKNYDDSSSLYQLNIENYAQRHYHTFAAIVRNAIWQHDGEGVFYTTPPPAQKLMAINSVKKQKPAITISSSEYLCCDMARIPDGKNLIYRTNIRNFSIDWLTKSEYSINNSTVYDMLPKLFHREPALAFVSKRDGQAQIYVQQGDNSPRAISAFENYKVFGNLDISFDDTKLLATEANRVHIFELKKTPNTSKPSTIHLDNRVRSAVWVSKNVIAVTHHDVDQSLITFYNQKGEALKTLASHWQSILIDNHKEVEIFLVDNERKLHQTTIKLMLSDMQLPTYIGQINHPVNRDTKINNGKLYQIPNNTEVLNISNINQPKKIIETHPFGDSYGFDVVDNTIVYSSLKYTSTELHRTK